MSSPAPRVAYFYKDEVGEYNYGPGHPMKPFRIRLAHNLIGGYGMLDRMACFTPPRLPKADMRKFHTADYLDFLDEVKPQHQQVLNQYAREQQERREDGLPVEAPSEALSQLAASFTKFGVDGDCPIFEGLYDFCELYSGGSVAGAWKLNRGVADIAINWSGGLHHAKKAECSGFCYTNDIVLAILELLRYNKRVLYIDIDVHHGDGVEEAFYLTDRVMTVSFHRHGGAFFPCTGALTDTGAGAGKNYALNFPLQDGIDDASYTEMFQSIIGGVMTSFNPDAIVLQCGADSLTGDKLGPFNLTLRGHGGCVAYCKSLGRPLLLLGGGGYTVENVARAWTFETAIALGMQDELSPDLPFNEYIEHWTPGYKLHLEPDPNRENRNDRAELQRIQCTLLQQLKELGGPPSVAYSTTSARDAGLHGWKDDIAAAAAEEASMDQAGDGATEGAGQHKGEFYRNNRDQDKFDVPPSSALGISRQKPAGQINDNAQPQKPATGAGKQDGAAPMEQ